MIQICDKEATHCAKTKLGFWTIKFAMLPNAQDVQFLGKPGVAGATQGAPKFAILPNAQDVQFLGERGVAGATRGDPKIVQIGYLATEPICHPLVTM